MAQRSPRPSRLAMTGLLLLLVGAVAGLDWQIANLTIDTSPVMAGALASDADAALAPPPEAKPFPSLAEFNEVLTRPLFAPDRRPPKAGEAKSPDEGSGDQGPAAGDPSFELGGITIVDGQSRALIRSEKGVSGEWLAIGDQIDGWTLDRVTDLTAELQSGGKRVTLQLYGDNGTAHNPPAESAAPAAGDGKEVDAKKP